MPPKRMLPVVARMPFSQRLKALWRVYPCDWSWSYRSGKVAFALWNRGLEGLLKLASPSAVPRPKRPKITSSNRILGSLPTATCVILIG